MKFRSPRVFKGVLFLIGGGLGVFLFCYPTYLTRLIPSIFPSPQEVAQKQILSPALSAQSVWDQDFLNQHSPVKEKIIMFENGQLCKDLKELDTGNLPHRELRSHLKKMDFLCFSRPLVAKSSSLNPNYLKVDQTLTSNPKEEDVAYQEICYKQQEPLCVIRLKRDGFPLNRRSNPHSTKAVLLDKNKDCASFDNEAFKVTSHGQAVPKGPARRHGIKKCPYSQRALCDQWIDAIMEQAHPPLKDPIPTRSRQ